MQEFPMHATTSVHLRDGVAVEARVSASDRDCGSITVGSWKDDNFELVFFGDAGMFRRLAEEFHKAADAVERKEQRQRALDNAPARRRTKYVLEGDTKIKEFMEAA